MNGDNGAKIGLCMHLRVLWEQHAIQFLASNLNLFFLNPFYIWLMSALDVIDLSL